MELSIIIVNYNVKYFLEHCLLSVLKACEHIDAEIFVVDNNSSDESIEYLQPKFSSVKFYRNAVNEGFAKANNSMLSKASGEYVLFLNPDTIVPEDCFTKCITFFKGKRDCGALGVRMTDGTGTFLKESKRALPGLFPAFYKTVGLSALFPSSKVFSHYYAAHYPENENNKVEVLAGAFMMLSRRAIDITKGFDESFFMYGEDVDLSFRVTKGGLFNYYFAETTIIHFKGESTQKNSNFYDNHFYGAMNLFAEKHYTQSKIRILSIRTGIAVAKFLKAISHENAVNAAAQSVTSRPKGTLILGSKEEAAQAVELLAFSENFVATGQQEVPHTKPAAVPPDQAVVFCRGQASYKLIIDLLPTVPKSCDALFFSSGAGSIIGSNNRNEKGVFIAPH